MNMFKDQKIFHPLLRNIRLAFKIRATPSFLPITKSVFLLMGLLILTSCTPETIPSISEGTTPSSSFSVTTSNASLPSEETTPSATEKPPKPSEIILGVTQSFSIFDPHKAVAAGDKEILFNIYEGLVKLTKDGDFIPALATDYTISEDALRYQFSIRPDVLFHNGALLTPEDVKYSLARASGLETGEPLVAELANIAEINILEGGIVEVLLKTPDAEMLPSFTTAIIPNQYTNLDKQPTGTGPFAYDRYMPGYSLTLKKHTEYWQTELPKVDKVICQILPDMDTAFLSLKNKAIHIFPYLTDDLAKQLEQDYTIMSDSSNMVQLLALNNQIPPFDNPKVREALNYAINKEDVIDQTMNGLGSLLETGMSPAMDDFYNKNLDGNWHLDREKAQSLLSEAGYPNGFNFEISVPNNYKIHVNTATVVQQQLKTINIHAEIKLVDWATWLSEVYTNRNYSATIIALTSNFSPRDVLSRYHSQSSINFINFSSTEFDQIFDIISITTSLDSRIQMYHQLQTILAQDTASIFLQDPSNIVAVHKDLHGYEVFPAYIQDLSTVEWN